MLPSRTEPNIRPNSSAELRRLPNFGPSLVVNHNALLQKLLDRQVTHISSSGCSHTCLTDNRGSEPEVNFPWRRLEVKGSMSWSSLLETLTFLVLIDDLVFGCLMDDTSTDRNFNVSHIWLPYASLFTGDDTLDS